MNLCGVMCSAVLVFKTARFFHTHNGMKSYMGEYSYFVAFKYLSFDILEGSILLNRTAVQG